LQQQYRVVGLSHSTLGIHEKMRGAVLRLPVL
jgi:hypothetical protein